MPKKADERQETAGDAEGARRATGASPAAAPPTVGPLTPGQRWSRARKREVVLRMFRGEPMDALSRELGVPVFRLEMWRLRGLEGLELALRERGESSETLALDEAMKRIGEITMENNLLRERCRAREANLPLAWRRSGR